ncbi:MAG: transposase [Candidatus Nanopelagicales bacterium]
MSFSHTVLVDMRARLRASADPRRLFRVVLDAASAAGLVGARRVLDSTPLYDAVATMDTITLIRSAIRALLKIAGTDLESDLRAVLSSGDDYQSLGKPLIDWDDPAGREALIDSRARDGYACLAVLEGRELDPVVAEAGELLATVLGQDLEQADPADGAGAAVFRIARRVAKDRGISTVDPQARHGHKTAARGFDGYKGHIAIDPDSEVITDTVVSAGNVGDAAVAADLVSDLGKEPAPDAAPDDRDGGAVQEPGKPSTGTPPTAAAGSSWSTWPGPGSSPGARPSPPPLRVGCSPRTGSTSTCGPAR